MHATTAMTLGAIIMDLVAKESSRNRMDTVGNIGIGDYFPSHCARGTPPGGYP